MPLQRQGGTTEIALSLVTTPSSLQAEAHKRKLGETGLTGKHYEKKWYPVPKLLTAAIDTHDMGLTWQSFWEGTKVLF